MEPKLFEFENDFAQDNIKCIPMIVRFKLDACGIKLKLSEWSTLNSEERKALVNLPADNESTLEHYRSFLKDLIYQKTGNQPTYLLDQAPAAWAITDQVPENLMRKVKQYDWSIPLEKWRRLSDLQRFSLIKLSQSAHENKNLPKAMKEFRLA